MQFIRRHWYVIGLLFTTAAVLWAWLGDLRTVQIILLLNFAVLPVHQFEEYAWPGGEPWIINELMMKKGNRPDRYPLNQNNAFFINVVLALPFYLAPVLFPDLVWLGLAPTLFGFSQIVVHGFLNNRSLRSLYNPGMAAVVLGHIPIGIWYLVEVHSKSMIKSWDWVFGIGYMAIIIGVGINVIGYGLLADEDSTYPFAREEMERFGRQDRLARIASTGSGQAT